MKTTMIRLTDTRNLVYTTCPTKNLDGFIELIKEMNPSAECETYEVGKMPLDKLPEEVQQEVKSILKAFDTCSVVYEYSKFEASTSICIKAHYNHDHFVCGRYNANEVYTPEERRQNYREVFGC